MKTDTTDTDPNFEFLGIPRRHWGQQTAAAYQAERNAVAAEAAFAAAEKTLADRREEVARTDAEARTAEEEARFAANRAREAREKAEKATSREDFETCKADAAKTKEEADDAAVRARDARQHADTVRNSLPIVSAEVERTRGNARRLRTEADAAAKRATETELPTIRANMARAEAAKRAEREAAALIEARAHIPHTACRDCRHWMPNDSDPANGTCHARPGEPPTVSAANWCALGEAVPPPSKK